MKKIISTILALIFIPAIVFAAPVPFRSDQVGSNPVNGYILQTNGSISSWVAVSFGSGSGTFSTTTSQVSGQYINYSNNNTDIVTVGGNSTSTATFIFNPNTASSTLSNALIKSLNGFTVFPDQLAGANEGAKLNAATALIPASGGTVDASNFTGLQAISASLFSLGNIDGRPITYIFGPASTTLNAFVSPIYIYDNVSLVGKNSTFMALNANSSISTTGGFFTTYTTSTTGNTTAGSRTLTVADASYIHVGKVIGILGGLGASTGQSTTLNGAIIDGTDTSLTLAGTTGFGDAHTFTFIVDNEVMTGLISGSTVINLVRGQYGTTATGHSSGATISILRGKLTRVTGVSGTTVTVEDASALTLTGTPISIGSQNISFNGQITIDPRYSHDTADAGNGGILLQFASNVYVGDQIVIKNSDHYGVHLRNSSYNDIGGTYISIGHPDTGLGFGIINFLQSSYNNIHPKNMYDIGRFAIGIDDRTSSADQFDGAGVGNIIDFGNISASSSIATGDGILVQGTIGTIVKGGRINLPSGNALEIRSNQWATNPSTSNTTVNIGSIISSVSVLADTSTVNARIYAGNLTGSYSITGSGTSVQIGNNFDYGNLGVGTSSPTYPLTVVGTGVLRTVMDNMSTAGTRSNGIDFQNANSGTNDGCGDFGFYTATRTNNVANVRCVTTTSGSSGSFRVDVRSGGGTIPEVFSLLNNRAGFSTTTPGTALSIAGVANLESTGSTFYSPLFAPNYTGTSTSIASTFPYASTTAISASSLTSGMCLQASTGGLITSTGAGCSSSGASPDWNKQTNYNVLTLTPTSTIPVWFKDQVFASSSAIFGGNVTASNFTATSSVASIFPYASTTALSASGNIYTTGLFESGTTTSAAKVGIQGAGTGTGVNFQTYNSNGTPLVTGLDNGSVGISTTTGTFAGTQYGLNISTSLVPLLVCRTGGVGCMTVSQNNVYAAFGRDTQMSAIPLTVSTQTAGWAFYSSNGTPGSVFDGGWDQTGKFTVGTTSPFTQAQINGTRPCIALSDSGAASGNKHQVWCSEGGNSYFGIASDVYATTTNLTILNGGNVGIGTTTPYAKLSVDGRGVFNQDVRADYYTGTSTSIASTFPYASTTAMSATTICLTGDACRTTWPTSGSGASADWNKQTTYNLLSLTPTTTIPVWFKDQIFASSSAIIDGKVTASNFLATSTATNRFNGNVGIGMDPAQALDVAGNIRVNNLIVDYNTNSFWGNYFRDVSVSGNYVDPSGASHSGSSGILAGNFTVLASTTLQNFTGRNATTTNATTTNLYASSALGVATTTLGSNATLGVQGAGTGTGINFQTYNSAGTPLVTGFDNGTLGIGTTTSTYNGTQYGLMVTTATPFIFCRTAGSGCTTLTHNNALSAFGRDSIFAAIPIAVTTQLAGFQFQTWNGASGSVNALNLAADGKVGIGTTTPAWLLQANGTRPCFAISDSSAGQNKRHWVTCSEGGNLYIATSSDALATSTKYAFSIDSTGQAYLGSYGDCSGATNALGITSSKITCDSGVSDSRLKKDVDPINDGLDTIRKLNPVSFYWKDLSYHNTTDPRQQYGFIAQEVEKVIPSAVGSSPDGYKTLDKTAIIPYLVDAVKTLSADTATAKRSVEENWQWIVIGLLALGLGYQQVQIRKLRK